MTRGEFHSLSEGCRVIAHTGGREVLATVRRKAEDGRVLVQLDSGPYRNLRQGKLSTAGDHHD